MSWWIFGKRNKWRLAFLAEQERARRLANELKEQQDFRANVERELEELRESAGFLRDGATRGRFLEKMGQWRKSERALGAGDLPCALGRLAENPDFRMFLAYLGDLREDAVAGAVNAGGDVAAVSAALGEVRVLDHVAARVVAGVDYREAELRRQESGG